MKKKNLKKNKENKFIKLLKVFTVFLIILTPFMTVFLQACLSKVNFEVEKLKKDVVVQERTNQSLEMKINELASLDNIQIIAAEKGLSYNNSNIKSINSQNR